MIRLSIIIPVFNVEEFIGECISSCLRQDIPGSEYEIILVDDCSSDKSIDVARKCHVDFNACVKPELRIVPSSDDSVSKGAAAARNKGLSAARGEYIWFIDSDDKIEDNCCGDLLSLATESKVDLLRFNFNLWTSEKTHPLYVLETTPVVTGWNLYLAHPRPIGIWSALWRKGFLVDNELSFLEGYVFEDEEFMPKAQYLALRAKMKDHPYYFYRQRSGSVMRHGVDEKKVYSYLAVCEALFEFRKERVSKECCARFDEIIAFLFTQAISLNCQSEKKVDLSVFKKQSCYPLRNVTGLKYWIMNHSLRFASIIQKTRIAIRRMISCPAK